MKVSDELRNWFSIDHCGSGLLVSNSECGRLLALADRIDSEMVELPKDADDEYIHIGDVMEWCDSGETLTVEGIGSDVLFYIDGENAEWTAARNKRHHHAPTVEDVLREFADEMNQNLGMYTGEAIDADDWRDADAKTVEKFAAKLRLAGDGE